MNKEKKVRLFMAIFGVLLTSVCMGILRVSLFGSAPFQCCLEGIVNLVPIGYGTFYVIASSLILAVMLRYGRRYIGIATFVNLFFFGYGVQFTEYLILSVVPEPTLLFRIGCLIVGLILIGFSVAMYVGAELGTAPYDGVALMMADYTVVKFRYCRIFTDVLCVSVGFAFGAIVGLGTVITAFCMGPFIDFFRTFIFTPLLERCREEGDLDGPTTTS